ncbi:hypothetical protein KMI_04g06280 [Encephalitozoon hellem]|uniref:Uncharacterized protein n=1 Tax=Encephalitozoon hellem TaxID=27973 RepID=A0A9Q9C3N0_ENCHE|nr:uncharacterized protein EHEL_040070 [Encephalitozoon hellem ATCC 50504]AFM98061.1 hypothetical protein EHEL_040070 [Encephalitozoon hellem ATCC 50504]KAG5859823.1 hypothetical protein KMI_04g06280 [Encephalitozoon hellem]UTX42900.1 hypothetical protein GPU96_04g06280 [Encephalitozoon hellem]WEL38357.1 hypothetical protein PFJ87_04g00260 [Encephalitozoon hellem]|eukprot:XP_003887042.1 hypothetical protein EHEL_040070 [Encephalitozoon hellem ATCC 50504]
MIFIGNRFDFEFTTTTSNPIRCAFGKQFFILLFSDNTGVYKGSSHHLCFVVPVHYPSFVRSVLKPKDLPLKESVDRLFKFKSPKDRDEFFLYVCSISNDHFEIIKELGPPKKISKENKRTQ